MPRNKRGGARGRGNFSSPRGGRGTPNPGTSFIPFAGAYVPQGPHTGNVHIFFNAISFTLQEEARNTERHHSFWNSDQRLRDTKVSFVSAGEFKPPDLIKDSEEALAEMTLESAKLPEKSLAHDVQMEDDEKSMAAPSSSFMIDTSGSKPVETGLAPPRLRSISPTRSDSSEEVILFHGRGQSGKRGVKIEDDPPACADPIDAKIKMVEHRILEQQKLLEETLDEKEASLESIPPELAEALNRETFLGAVPHRVANSPSPDFEAILPKRQNKGRHQGRARRSRRATGKADVSDEEDAIIADYIANMDQEQDMDDVDQTFNKRELGGDDDAAWQDDSSVEEFQDSDQPERHGWSRTELQDLDDLSTSDEARGKVQTVLSKRHRVGGVQYLIVWEHQDVDEARWVPLHVLQDSGAFPLIEVFEAEEKLIAEFESNGDEDNDDSNDIGDEDDEDDDDHDDEQDLVQRRIDRMDDEQIARLLSKQEELGMGGNEILLFDDDVNDEDDEIEAPVVDLGKFILSGRRGRKERQRRQGEFPPAVPLADAYDGFDVMDFDRPSLKKKPKGRKGKLILDDISDSELEASMQSAWDNDRVKKKERKQEREVLRAQGLLTGKHGKPDMKARYKEGMSINDVKEEIKEFLKGDSTTLSLPAMDKANRKFVHEIANAFKLKSKSAGLGNKRYPILYRTARTTVYGERAYEAAASKLSRRFLPRNDVGGRRAGAAPRRGGRAGGGGGGGFGGGFGAASYRDGDVVGASAPELGVENKGRAMLEKMGWSAGTALGALDNKGILQPVSHVVKTTKAGLG
ncbi:squalene synthetase-like protein [Ciborinia camelliae]|nr:squalene synthetase-like protein [Ciborinia camelliae]